MQGGLIGERKETLLQDGFLPKMDYNSKKFGCKEKFKKRQYNLKIHKKPARKISDW